MLLYTVCKYVYVVYVYIYITSQYIGQTHVYIYIYTHHCLKYIIAKVCKPQAGQWRHNYIFRTHMKEKHNCLSRVSYGMWPDMAAINEGITITNNAKPRSLGG